MGFLKRLMKMTLAQWRGPSFWPSVLFFLACITSVMAGASAATFDHEMILII